MKTSLVTEGIHQLLVNVEDILFEGLWEIPNGVSLNSYIVKGEKNAIIDGVCGWDGVPETLYQLLDEIDLKPEDIDYVVINHMEPDHSGWIENLKKVTDNFKVVAGKKSIALLEDFYGYKEEDMICVSTGDTLDLGQERILNFVEIPNVHWPDTIATFDTKSGTIFPCDAFGSYGSVEKPYDDMLSEEEITFYEKEAVRYYANIVASFSLAVDRAIAKCAELPIKIIAPGHGIVWRKNPNKIVEDYSRYASYFKNPKGGEVTVIFGSMYGMTEKVVDPIVKAIEGEGIKVNVRRVPEDSWGSILMDSWNSTGIVLAMPTYEYKMFPPMASVLHEMGNKKIVNRKALHVGSYGWSGGAKKELDKIMEEKRMNWDFIDSLEFKGSASNEEIEKICEAAKKLAIEVKSIANK